MEARLVVMDFLEAGHRPPISLDWISGFKWDVSDFFFRHVNVLWKVRGPAMVVNGCRVRGRNI